MAFYFNDNGNLLEAPNYVAFATFELHASQKDTYTYPIEGWYWFDTELKAKEFFEIE